MTFSVVRRLSITALAIFSLILLQSCVFTQSSGANMGMTDISPQMRSMQIASEPTGDFYYGRRYYIEKTRFWGYVRKPRQPWSRAKLVIMNESSMLQPDRLPEAGPVMARYGYDQNFEYRIWGHFTGRKIYEPASNLFLSEFKATDYREISNDGGWLFTPQDHYDRTKITLVNGTIDR